MQPLWMVALGVILGAVFVSSRMEPSLKASFSAQPPQVAPNVSKVAGQTAEQGKPRLSSADERLLVSHNQNVAATAAQAFITFLERAPSNVISPARNWGACGFWWPDDERLLLSIGAFRDGTGSDGQAIGDDDWAFTARLTGLPLYEPDGDDFRLVHVGGAVSLRVPPDGIINFTPRTGSNLLTVADNPGSPFLPSLEIPSSSYQLYNLQAASVFGTLSLQAEWSAAYVQQTVGDPIFVHGIYIYGSYFLTGEHRGYNRTQGSFDQVQIYDPVTRTGCGRGAVELAMRFAYFDFSSPNLPPDTNGDPAATYLSELTLGVNWYLNSYTRIMFNYTAGLPDKVGFDPTVAHIFGIRTALYW